MVGTWKVVVAVALSVAAVAAQEDPTCGGEGQDPCPTCGGEDQDPCPGYAGYETSTDVRERGEIDLDVKEMTEAADKGEFATAKSIFENGENSLTSDGGFRTLAGFSQNAEEKMSAQRNFQIFKEYYGISDYCYRYVKDALDGTGEFSSAPVETRAETSVKGAQYQCTLMYVIHEMEDAIVDCDAGNPTNNDGAAKAWDEAVAFYVGSMVGSSQASTAKGELQYGLAKDRFAQFDGAEDINAAVITNFKNGKAAVESRDCRGMESLKDAQVDLFKVPLLQGLIRYAYLADENGPGTDGETEANINKARGEGNAFARALLPWIHETDAGAATMINDNFPPTGQAVKDGYRAVVDRLNTLYGKGEFSTVTENQVGTFREAEETGTGGGLSAGAIVGIVIGVIVGLLLLIAIVVLVMRRNKSKSAAAQKEASLHSNGVTQSADYIPPQGP